MIFLSFSNSCILKAGEGADQEGSPEGYSKAQSPPPDVLFGGIPRRDPAVRS